MLQVGKEVAAVACAPSVERIRALKRILPAASIRAILRRTGQTRKCPRLPKSFMVWFVIALGLFSGDCYRQVFRWLQPGGRGTAAGKSSLCEARRRLGPSPLRRLFESAVRLLASPGTPGAFYQGMRLMAVDGFVLDLADTPENEKAFGRPGGGRAPGAFPQVRVLALCEVGTHVVWKCLPKPIRAAEITMARFLLKALRPDMLLLWDRGFLSWGNVRDVLGRKAHLLARIKKTSKFEKLRVLGDGSYLAKMYRNTYDRRNDRGGIVVRVVEYTLEDPGRPGSGQPNRLLTTLLDAEAHPATRLVELYHERWEIELAIDEVKTHQRQDPVLRSRNPAGVVQEVYGLLLAHYVVRHLMAEAAAKAGLSPRRISFTGTLKILRCRLPECPRGMPALKAWHERLLAEVADELLPERRDRVNPRVIKRKMSKWPKKRAKHRQCPQPTVPFRMAVRINC